MFNKKTIDDVELHGKTVLVRVDYNVPVKDGVVMDDYRVVKSLPTINKLLDADCKVVLMSHLGRPKAQEEKYSLAPVAETLRGLIDADVAFVQKNTGDVVKQAVKNMDECSVLLLENLRFDPGEKAKDEQFAKSIVESVGPDVFVQNAFGVVHREDASVYAVTQFAPAVAGYLVAEEVKIIADAISNPTQPVVAVVGGSKLETKLKLLTNLMNIADHIVVGGVMSNTFLKASGYNVGSSVYEEDEIGAAKSVLSAADAAGVKIFLPTGGVAVGDSFDNPGKRREVTLDTISDDDVILDVGKESIKEMLTFVKDAKTVIWNGPLGVTEYDQFATGSRALADFIVENKIYTIVGGGDTAGFINEIGYVDEFAHVSTGGGASLELMAGNKLPGVEALLNK